MKHGYAVKVSTTKEISLVEISRTNELEFVNAIQREVGGFFECVNADLPIDEDILMHVDEEGKFKGKEINHVATRLYNNPFDLIVGDVLLMPVEIDPESEYGECDSMPMQFKRAAELADLCEKVYKERKAQYA